MVKKKRCHFSPFTKKYIIVYIYLIIVCWEDNWLEHTFNIILSEKDESMLLAIDNRNCFIVRFKIIYYS